MRMLGNMRGNKYMKNIEGQKEGGKYWGNSGMAIAIGNMSITSLQFLVHSTFLELSF